MRYTEVRNLDVRGLCGAMQTIRFAELVREATSAGVRLPTEPIRLTDCGCKGQPAVWSPGFLAW